MKYIEKTYRSFVEDILDRKKDIVPFVFEGRTAGLTHKEYLLVVYSMLKQRPENKVLSMMLLNYVRSTDKPVPAFIKKFSQEISIHFIMEPHTSESKRVSASVANSSVFNQQYQGFVYAVNIDTMQITSLTDSREMREQGFIPSRVKACLAGDAYTHRNHVFIRDNEEDKSYERIKSSIREGPGGVSEETD